MLIKDVVAQYGGDPRPYVDCGTVTTLVDGAPTDPPREFDAAKAAQRTAKTANRRRYGLLRELNLDKGGVVDELVDREVISFRSDTVGRFAKGTICIGTGKIEALPLVPFRRST